jgi:hypothetical protein
MLQESDRILNELMDQIEKFDDFILIKNPLEVSKPALNRALRISPYGYPASMLTCLYQEPFRYKIL